MNSKVTEVENKIKAIDIIAKSPNTKANTIRSDLTGYAKKADVATDITAIKSDYVTNASLTSQLNDLKSQHIATKVTVIDNKAKKNESDILALENKLIQKEDTINENERGLSVNRGLFFYMDQIILYTTVNWDYLILLVVVKYLRGNQKVFLIILIILIRMLLKILVEACLF